MTTKIKFCGLKTPEAIDLAADLGAWKAGFIFFGKSPRNVSLDTAAELAARARARGLETVAVTVDAGDDELAAIAARMRPDMLQFHGTETPERLAQVKRRHGLPVMKALSVREAGDLAAVEPYRGVADLILFDAKPPKNAELPGGNGVSFDWSLLSQVPADLEYVLSGGLSAESAGVALATSGARYLDVSSGIESAPGIKDPERMRAFAAAVADHDARGGKIKEAVS